MRIPFAQIDAFADTAFAGNPAAVMPLSAWLDDAVLLDIAQENNLSETAFIVPSAEEGVDFDLRWFTPGAEVALCGHATLASGHFVLSSDSARDRVRFATRQAGILEVACADGGYTLELPAWAPAPKAIRRSRRCGTTRAMRW
jgi:PhzF family phenazine biosynthesis protein